MSLDYHVGPAVNLSQVARERGLDIDELMFSAAPKLSRDDYAEMLADGFECLYDEYVDAVIYDFCRDLDSELGKDVFRYVEYAPTGDLFVYANTRKAYATGADLASAIGLVKRRLGGDGVSETWLEYTTF